MGYSFESRVRFSESGEDGCLTLPAILDYFQDCATFEGIEIHQSLEERLEKNLAWVLSSWQVQVERYPKVGEKIRITTFPYEWKAFIGLRNFIMEAENGEVLARANSYWTNLNIKTGRPERLTEEDKACYGLEERISMEYAPRKVPMPDGGKAEEAFSVQPVHLDANHHVNNCQYIKMAINYLPEGCRIKEMRAEYMQQGRLGDIFIPVIVMEEGHMSLSFTDSENKPYSVMEFFA